MSPEAMKQMADVSRRIKNPVDIRLHIGDDPRSQELATFCRELSQQIPAIRISEQTTDEAAAMPGMQIGTSIIYQGVPQGTETGAFLDVLQKVSEQDTPAIQTGRETGWDIPSMLRLYVSGMCTFCPREVQKLTALVLQQTGLRLTIIDAREAILARQAE